MYVLLYGLDTVIFRQPFAGACPVQITLNNFLDHPDNVVDTADSLICCITFAAIRNS
jgi:hypothetical protein